MPCGSFGVTQILVGLYRIGVVGLRQALREVDSLDLRDQGLIVDDLLSRLAEDNLVPDRMLEDYRTALWREYLRLKGGDLTAYYSPVEVTLRCHSGEAPSGFIDKITSVFADFELRPEVAIVSTTFAGPSPQLLYGDHMIVQGDKTREKLKAAVRQSFSDW